MTSSVQLDRIFSKEIGDGITRIDVETLYQAFKTRYDTERKAQRESITRSAAIKQAGEVKFLKAQGWTLQAIQASYPDAQYSTLHRTFAGLNNKAVAPAEPEWFRSTVEVNNVQVP